PRARPQKAVRPAAPQAQLEAANSVSSADRASVLPVLPSQLTSPELAASAAQADMELLRGRELLCVLAKSPKKRFCKSSALPPVLENAVMGKRAWQPPPHSKRRSPSFRVARRTLCVMPSPALPRKHQESRPISLSSSALPNISQFATPSSATKKAK